MRCISIGMLLAGFIGVAPSALFAQSVRTFSNPTPIEMRDGPPITSTMTVEGLTGHVVKVAVALNNVTHSSLLGLRVWLVAPDGGAIVLLTGAAVWGVSETTLVFDDCAPRGLAAGNVSTAATTIRSGRYRPHGGQLPIGAGWLHKPDLASFSGPATDRNGPWSLHVSAGSADDIPGDVILTEAGASPFIRSQPPPRMLNNRVCGQFHAPNLTTTATAAAMSRWTRPTSGEWFVLQSSTNTGTVVNWGAPSASGAGDIAAPGDYDGDGQTDIAIYRATTGTWYVRYSFGGTATIPFGAASAAGLGDTPVPGDYDGDGITDLAIYRAGAGQWWIISNSNGSGITVQTWGAPGLGDYPARR